MITVKDVLMTKAFQNAQVIAGEDGLSRVIKTITVAEVPDAANWLQGAELVCTTAFFISKGVENQIKWIESLISNGASALAIKSSRFLGTIPKPIVDVANRLNFPLIEMPTDVIWPMLIESVMNLLTDEQTKVLRRAEEIHTKLTDLVLENESIQVISDTISGLVGNMIIVEDARLNVIATGNVFTDDEPSEWYKKLIDKRIGEPFRNKVLHSNFYKTVLRVRKKDRLEIKVTEGKDSEIRNIMIPILSNQVIYGFISLVELTKPYSTIDLIALEHGATALALQFMKQIINEQTIRTKTLTLIDDLVHGRFHSENVSEHHIYHIDRSNPMLVIMIETSTEQQSEGYYDWNRSDELIHSTIKKMIENHFHQVIIGQVGSLLTILVPYPQGMKNKVTGILEEVLKKALNELKDQLGIGNLRIGMGSAYHNLSLLEKSYKEANMALSIAKSFPKKGNIILFENLGIHRIISMIHSLDEMRSFCHDFLSELRTHDQESDGMLLETLYAYLKSDCSIYKAAPMLFVHPNTVLYRLKKIKKIILHDINEVEFKFTYLFALEAHFMLNDSK
jgi:PucR family transcriptional regulator, purine catabolism regulatory protein